MAKLSYDILEKFGTLSTSKSGWELQLNFVQWGENKPKFDLRSWSPDNSKMGKGLTLSHDEVVALYDVLTNVLAAEHAPVTDVTDDAADTDAQTNEQPKWGRLDEM
ncbi:YdbC family protein [Weissella paramesenteroides]|jgi:hypothetical protein|uniref:YdbC family protein n=1 Tax=Weissella paramesenteroides TaxID=1249 RepID=UPI001238D71D|nr:PC4/YdbC family ssDNA-binding protein [Weissella paramesenteroides]KAA8458108.1 hypothetical protein FKV86_01050 [Weissella paramesenteroides]KAA8458677.1 hypothetical protein FKV82_05785 [Weissella paramesenteroides]KAA8459349.1 hypothetical protein FKV78_02230 [Weissella paramesenteroides]KAA8463347.1 hypothetical protein FKV83_09645 [Weissella paramesenteroides]KAA8463816.1 hypothetical protein FKV85_02755 [Weissella paramesenteroides]